MNLHKALVRSCMWLEEQLTHDLVICTLAIIISLCAREELRSCFIPIKTLLAPCLGRLAALTVCLSGPAWSQWYCSDHLGPPPQRSEGHWSYPGETWDEIHTVYRQSCIKQYVRGWIWGSICVSRYRGWVPSPNAPLRRFKWSISFLNFSISPISRSCERIRCCRHSGKYQYLPELLYLHVIQLRYKKSLTFW